MRVWQAIVLGAVQGLTEFLPVSSSGHLILFQRWLDFDADGGLLFDVFLHLGTLIPVAAVFGKSIKRLFIKPYDTLRYLIIASIPAAVTGFLLQDKIEVFFYGNDLLSAVLLSSASLVTAAELIFAQKISEKNEKSLPLSLKSSIIMGVFQGAAIIPGVSRSGTVITGGAVAGLSREKNAEFAFLMSIPIILGAAVSSGAKAAINGANVSVLPLLFGIASSAVTGYIAIKFMLKTVLKGNYIGFSAYLICLAALSVLTKVLWGV